jgi:hypothetical protein
MGLLFLAVILRSVATKDLHFGIRNIRNLESLESGIFASIAPQGQDCEWP